MEVVTVPEGPGPGAALTQAPLVVMVNPLKQCNCSKNPSSTDT